MPPLKKSPEVEKEGTKGATQILHLMHSLQLLIVHPGYLNIPFYKAVNPSPVI